MRPKLLKEKPLTVEQRKKLNEAVGLLSTWQHKSDLAYHFKCDERTARDMVSTIAKRVAIISTSERRGYKRALTIEDLSLARQSVAELGSRISELFARKQPLDEFIEKCEKTIAEQEQMEMGV